MNGSGAIIFFIVWTKKKAVGTIGKYRSIQYMHNNILITMVGFYKC